jgi:hypothetical protein
LGVGGNVPKKRATNTNGIEGLMPAELVKKIVYFQKIFIGEIRRSGKDTSCDGQKVRLVDPPIPIFYIEPLFRVPIL